MRPACEGTQRMPRSLSRAFVCASFAPIDHRRSGPSGPLGLTQSIGAQQVGQVPAQMCQAPAGPHGLRRRRIRP